MYNLTNSQKDLLRQLVQKVREGHMPEEFFIAKNPSRCWIHGDDQSIENILETTPLALKGLEDNGLLRCERRQCTVTGKAYEAVDTNFNAQDTSSC